MFASTFELSNLNGSNGFAIHGIQEGDQLGGSVAGIGDLNGDGLADILLGASSADVGGLNSGQALVVFGRRPGTAGQPSSFNGSALNGSNGFRINGTTANDFAGFSVNAAGDINGDGLADLVVGAYGADPFGSSSGQTYVVFGSRSAFAADLSLNALNGTQGFRINGVSTDDFSGYSVSAAGDVNGDGIDDLLIGAYGGDPNGSPVGQAYVVFGRRGGFGATFNLGSLDGSNGFRLNGIALEDQAGFSVSTVGDVNGDGIDDLLIGAPAADENGFSAGQAYVVFGRSGGFSSTLNLDSLNGSTGFRIDGLEPEEQLGFSVSGAGDINGDGVGDFVVGAPGAGTNGPQSGKAYVIFGRSLGFSSAFNLDVLNGQNGFQINGLAAGNRFGEAVSSAGDLNNDGFDDLVIGASSAAPNGLFSAGQTYVIFGGRSTYPTTLSLNSLNGRNGFRINGQLAVDRSGRSLSRVGDFNGDRIDDLLIGAPDADPDGNLSTGKAYILFGQPGPIDGLTIGVPTVNASRFGESLTANLRDRRLTFVINNRLLTRNLAAGTRNVEGTQLGDRLVGSNADNTLQGNAGADRMLGLEGNDILVGGQGNDEIGGGQGNDTLNGGQGRDVLTGNGGQDKFVFDIGRRFDRNLMGVDRLADFASQQDQIVLDKDTFRIFNIRPFSFASVANATGVGTNEALIVYVREIGALYYNPNGSEVAFGTGGLFAIVQSGAALSSANFILRD